MPPLCGYLCVLLCGLTGIAFGIAFAVDGVIFKFCTSKSHESAGGILGKTQVTNEDVC
jgi:hypothetical protein